MVGQPMRHVPWPVTAGFQTQGKTCTVKTRFESVECVCMPDCLADDRKVVGISTGHRGKHGFDSLKGGTTTDQSLTIRFGDDDNTLVVLAHDQ